MERYISLWLTHHSTKDHSPAQLRSYGMLYLKKSETQTLFYRSKNVLKHFYKFPEVKSYYAYVLIYLHVHVCLIILSVFLNLASFILLVLSVPCRNRVLCNRLAGGLLSGHWLRHRLLARLSI